MHTYDSTRQDQYSLTDEQRELAAKHHNLIYRFAQIKEADLEEFYGVFAIGLCKAARIYDASLGYKFSTLAFHSMNNEYNYYWRHELNSSHIPSNSIISYNTMIDPENGDAEFLGIITNRLDSCLLDTGRIEVIEFFNSLDTIQRIVLNGLMDGYKETEIAEYIGCTRSNVSRVKRMIMRKWEVTKHYGKSPKTGRRHTLKCS